MEMVDGIPRIFAEYVNGGSLADWIHRRRLYRGGPEQTLERLLDVAIQCAWGLHAAHEHGLVHQDIKPANVMLTSQGIAKVTDFGLAKARAMAGEQEVPEGDEHHSILVSSRGMTPAYCSPEQAAGLPLSRRTDIWSWGISVLEMWLGKVTWQSGIQAREVLANYKLRDGSIVPMPTDLVQLLERCFAWRPEKRPTTMLEVATELQTLYARLRGQPYPRESPTPTSIQVHTLVNRGYSLQELGRSEEALLAYEQAITLDPTDAFVHTHKGNVLDELGRTTEAFQVYQQARALQSRS
ncbi:hypothetical protein ccbrp13_16400 [Ktedonobacteria bacterium brp13]|nr:hypothetical protein ccbrp13_16400 [Ktedonobacteria bacterium brp13]